MLKEIIAPSTSPWHAQVVLTSHERHKNEWLSTTPKLDAYAFPHIDDQINEIAKNNVFSAIDLKDVYYQVPLHDNAKQYTAFQAACKLSVQENAVWCDKWGSLLPDSFISENNRYDT